MSVRHVAPAVRLIVVALALGSSSCAPDDVSRDAGQTAQDDGASDVVDAGPGSGAACSFHRECPSTERCACSEADGCACATGARGTGALGAACDDGITCASNVCLQGPGDVLMCSIECVDDTGCTEPLPLCSDIAFVGRICVRRP